MTRSLRVAVLVLAIALAPRAASAAFINFIENPDGVSVVNVATNLVLTAPLVLTAQSATVVGFHHPGISFIPVTPGSRSAGLFVPGVPNLLTAYILFTAGEIRGDPVFGVAQDLTIQFSSQNILVGDLPAAFPFGGGVAVNGALQDLSSFLGTLPEGVVVRAQSPVPEPASLLLLGTGVLVLARKIGRRRP